MKLLRLSVLISIFMGLFILGPATVHAYQFPIPELGFCRDARECHTYCEVPQHKATCWSYKVYGNKSAVLGEQDASSSATTGENKLQALGISFPIAELGGCSSISACRAFCSITQNQAACRNFAAKSGLANKASVIEHAKTELGCTDAASCKAYCEQNTNQEACKSFAYKYQLKVTTKDQLVEKAKTVFGCTTKEQCLAFCAQTTNRDRCKAFAQQNNLGEARREELVKTAKEQLGCTSFEECKRFCQNEVNHDKCRNFGTAIRTQIETQVKQKLEELGNCKTPEECRNVCQEHPEKCPNFPQLPQSNTTRPNSSFKPYPSGLRPSGIPQQFYPPAATNSTGIRNYSSPLPAVSSQPTL
jgi:hypothetical protein